MTTPAEPDTKSTTQTMKAAIYTRYGHPRDVLEVTRMDKPVPGTTDLLVKVGASSVNALDFRLITGTPYLARMSGIRTPARNIPGADVSGTIEAVGSEVIGFSAGDTVFAEVGGGGFAEYVLIPAEHAAPTPENLSLDESATLGVAALTALQGLRDWGNLQPGQSVLVNGASGGVGTFAVQIAKALGAGQVTAVCSTDKVEIARSLGADHVIDYTKEDFTRVATPHDLLFDNAGMTPFSQCRRVMTEGGTQVAITGPMHKWFGPMRPIIWSAIRAIPDSRKFVGAKTAKLSTDDLITLKGMVESGLLKPVMDRRFTLDEAVEALEYQGEGHAKGKSIVVP